MRCAKLCSVLLVIAISLTTVSCSEDSISNSSRVDSSLDEVDPGEMTITEIEGDDGIVISDGIDELNIKYNRGTGVMHFECGEYHLEFSQDYIKESTKSDELTVWFEDEDYPKRTEVYTYNGDRFKIDIQDGQLSDEDVAEFLQHYNSDPSENTLEHNADGEKMVFLLEEVEPELVSLWQQADPEGYLKYMMEKDKERELASKYKWWDQGCGYATLCGVLKCMIGLFANSVCVFCTMVTVICAFVSIYGWW